MLRWVFLAVVVVLGIELVNGAPAWQMYEWEFMEGSGSGSGNITNLTNATGRSIEVGCVLSILPCSYTIIGNLILIVFYGAILAVAAKMISDGAELLLDLGLPAALIGGIVLPLLGAVPDCAMIVASGLGTKTEANEQIAVGMGTLAGSTIMLLTLPWLGSLVLARVDIVRGQGKDNQCSRFSLKSFFKQGVTVFPDVTYSSIIMLVTTLPYFIVQGSDWYYGPAKEQTSPPAYIRDSALAAFVIAILLFIAYLVIQAFYSVSSKRKEALRREEEMKRRVLKRFYQMSMRQFQAKATPTASVQAAGKDSATGTDTTDSDEKKPLLSTGLQKKAFNTWRMHRGAKEGTDAPAVEKVEPKEEQRTEAEQSEEDPKWKISLKSCFLLSVGVALVTIFSDPMVGVITAIADSDHHKYSHDGKHGNYIPIKPFYLSFVITPICSNASEIVSSLMFAMKKKKVNSSLTFSQLYGAATMNNTLCLGVFAALVYFRDLDWQYSAEVTVILFVEFSVGILAIISGFGFKHTYILITGFFVGALYFISILMVYLLETYAKWK